MSQSPSPRLVYERWTDAVAGDILEAADIDVVKLDLSAPAEDGWAVMESAHGYQVATRPDVASARGGERRLVRPALVQRCEQLLAVGSAGPGSARSGVVAAARAGL